MNTQGFKMNAKIFLNMHTNLAFNKLEKTYSLAVQTHYLGKKNLFFFCIRELQMSSD